jgi:hypothetical protein
LLRVLREPDDVTSSARQQVLSSDMRLGLNPHVYVLRLNSDVTRVVDLLRAHQPPDESIHCPTVVATRRASEDEIQAVRISPLSAEFLSLCDGRATVDEILHKFAPECPTVGSLTGWDVATEALRMAYRNRLVRASCSAA